MAKILKYQFLTAEVNRGTDGSSKIERIYSEKTMAWSEANEAIAKAESHNGEYTIEDDGQPDPSSIPSQLDRVEAQVNYTAMMTNTLMEGV